MGRSSSNNPKVFYVQQQPFKVISKDQKDLLLDQTLEHGGAVLSLQNTAKVVWYLSHIVC